MITKCQFCQKEFQAFPQRIRIGRAKFCSKICSCTSKRRKVKKECLNCGKEFMKKPCEIKRGSGKYCSQKCFRSHHVVPKGENHYAWKGDKIGYYGVHSWIRRISGYPKKCENCGTETAKKFEWSNISGEYRRDINDWKRLCTKCHIAFDDSSIRGEDHVGSKLTNEKVTDIRNIYATHKTSYERLAIEYQVSIATIHNVINRKTWKHVQPIYPPSTPS